MTYEPKAPLDQSPMARWVADELEGIEREFLSAREFLHLVELNAAPSQTFTGMIVLADGTNWNPGSGAGVYAYYSGAWNFLG